MGEGERDECLRLLFCVVVFGGLVASLSIANKKMEEGTRKKDDTSSTWRPPSVALPSTQYRSSPSNLGAPKPTDP
eukprot:2948915-Rhodomonas_salina.4